jgi:hypothetical protein
MNMPKSRFLKPFNFIITLKVESLLRALNPNSKEILPMCNNNSCTHNLKPNPQIPTTSITLKKQAKELHKCKLHNAYKNIEA